MGFKILCYCLGFGAIVALPYHEVRAEEGMSYLTGVDSPEDLVAIPGTAWILTSSLGSAASPGGLFVVSRQDRTISRLEPVSGANAAHHQGADSCPGVPDLSGMVAHGINLRPGKDGKHLLYVVNHGGREAIEYFEIDANSSRPIVTWIGCVPLPEGVIANGVAPLPNGAIAVTHMAVPRYFSGALSPNAYIEKFAKREITGYAARWDRAKGWQPQLASEASGPNGIEASLDGNWIWVANWPTGEIVGYAARDGGAKKTIRLSFLPDNLRWGSDGWLWTSGAVGTTTEYFTCLSRTGCMNEYKIARINPRTLKVQEVRHPSTQGKFGDATTALEINGEIWLGAHPSDRVANFRK